MQIKDHSCVRINSSTEPAYAITEASVSGYRLDSGTRSINLKYLLYLFQFCKIKPTPGKKMKKLYARCFGHTNCGVIFVL